MRAGLRLGEMLLAAGLMLGAPAALAQSAQQTVPPATTNTPATDTVGPRDLQNFSLGGTVTRRAEPVAPATAAPARSAPTAPTAAGASAPVSAAPARTRTTQQTASATAGSATRTEPRPDRALQASTEPPAAATAPLDSGQGGTASVIPSPAQALPASNEGPALAPDAKLALWPWLLAAIALGAGAAFLFWRNRRQEAFAGSPGYDAFSAPEPEPEPKRAPAPRPAPRPAPPAAVARPQPEPSIPGTVTTRLRPWLEIGINPTRFVVDDQQVALEFELELFNSGNAPARAVLVEATLLNAGNDQEDLLRGFFANPVGKGQRIVSIPPMKRVALKTQVAVGREHVQQYDVGGKKVCVPLLGLNALYKWNNGSEGQTSASYLLGRDTEGEKLAPFRLDLGPRLFRGVGARLLPSGLRT